MVVHSPNPFDVQRAAAAAAAAAQTGNVPPAVLAAGAAAQPEPVVETEDLLGDNEDFEAWDTNVPPARRLHVDVHAEEDGHTDNVTTRRGRVPSPVRRPRLFCSGRLVPGHSTS